MLKILYKKRYFQLYLQEYPDLDWLEQFIGNFTMDIPYTAVVTFKNLKWTGSSNQANFKLSASTILNLNENSTNVYDDLIIELGQYSAQELYDFVINGNNLSLAPDRLLMLQEAARSLLDINFSLEDAVKNTSYQSNGSNGAILTKTLHLFSTTYAFMNLIKSILIADSKNVITDKIYVTSSAKKIQVLNLKIKLLFLIRFFLMSLKKLRWGKLFKWEFEPKIMLALLLKKQ